MAIGTSFSIRRYGWWTQDFRFAGLDERIREEKERLEEMREELAEVREKVVKFNAGLLGDENVQLKERSEKYVRLPLFNSSGATLRRAPNGGLDGDIYPHVDNIETRVERIS